MIKNNDKHRFSADQIKRIIGIAQDLFVKQVFTQMDDEAYTLADADLFNDVIDVLADGGLLFMATWDDVSDWWIKIRQDDDKSYLCEWLLQSASSFSLQAFGMGDEYDYWCIRIANTYGQMNGSSQIKFVAIDTDLLDRLAKPDELYQLLIANPWLTYLYTLQLSLNDILDLQKYLIPSLNE